jgi:N-acetylglutamate synthase-like GNAT family acetyltransferase
VDPGSTAIEILPATAADGPDILALQRLAYQSEACLYGDPQIPPLTQSLEELEAEIRDAIVLKACSTVLIVGSVRARRNGTTCAVGRLMVHPEWQRRGLGSRLMRRIEASFPDVERFELFTGDRSEANIRFYSGLGYEPVRKERLSPRVSILLLEKRQAA